MAYSMIKDLIKWISEEDLIRLCTASADAALVDAEVADIVAEMIESADGEIDGYLLSRWAGLRGYSPVPPEINRISAQIAIYNLFLRHMQVPEEWRKRYEDCIRKLEQAAKGDLTLGLDSAGTQVAESEAQYQTDAGKDEDELPQQYTKDKLELL